MKIVFTGHRPDRLGKVGYLKSPLGLWIKDEMKKTLTTTECEEATVGGAQGADTIAAFTCLELKIPYKVYLPFKGYQERWSTTAKHFLDYILAGARQVIYVRNDYAPAEPWEVYKLFQNRNMAMVDYVYNDNPKENMLVSVYDGSDGGTHKCIWYATRTYPKMLIKNINPYDFKR